MGLDINGTRLLLNSWRQGLNFEKTLTIGRQGLYLTQKALKENFEAFDVEIENIESILPKNGGFADPFFELLGVKNLDSLDASGYEGASVIHDLNYPQTNMNNKYSVVFDGGSLEHIFNFPIAIKSCMEMVAENGHFIGISPTNNYLGHGFYQFSPELFFRIFSEDNGYEIKEMLFFNGAKRIRDQRKSKIYALKDPLAIGKRVELTNAFPSYLYIVAKKKEIKDIFKTPVLQSDYAQGSWLKKNVSVTKKPTLNSALKRIVPEKVLRYRRNLLLLKQPFGNGSKKQFEPVNIP